MADKIRVTVKEKILIHLLNYTKYREKAEVPVQISQDGMAKAIGVRRSHIASALKDLREAGQIEEEKTRFRGEMRRKNAYFLLHEGQGEALRLKETLLEKDVILKKEDREEKKLKISEINKNIEGKLTILEILNRLSDEGIFDLTKKFEEEKREEEKSVFCPYCGKENKNPDLREKETEDEKDYFRTPCLFCGLEFLTHINSKGQMIPKVLSAQPINSEEEQVRYFRPVKPFQVANPLLVSLGLFLMLLGFALVLIFLLTSAPSVLGILAPGCFLMSFLLLFFGLKDVKHLDAITRRILIVTGAVFVSFIAFFFGFMTEAEYDREQAWIMAIVVFPAFGVLIFGKPLATKIRSELSLSLGIFLVLFGISTIAFHEMFSWQSSFSPFWVITGSVMIITSNEIERLRRFFIFRSLCVGVGVFMAIFSFIIIISDYPDFGSFKTISMILWLLLGVVLVFMRFFSEELCERTIKSLKSALLFGLGVLFVLMGILLALYGRYMEFGVELFIGAPIIWYGLTSIKKFELTQIGLIAYIIALEVFTVLSLIML
jgi:hypothetical protein